MPVIVRERRTIAGEGVEGVQVYKMGRPGLLTREARQQAERLDRLLAERMAQIEREITELGLLRLKGTPGVLPLWYEVGKRLSFVVETDLVSAEERKYVWRALYDHAGNLVPGTPKVRADRRPLNSHFKYCYEVGRHPWDFVRRAGTWTTWYEFLDSQVIRDDNRILDWFGRKQERYQPLPQNWLRRLTKAVRRELRNVDTSYFSQKELNSRLDQIYEKVFGF